MLTKDQYNELLFNRNCSLIVIEHLDVYQVLHWTPAQFFARKNGNIISHNPKRGNQQYEFDADPEDITFVVLLERGIDLRMIHESSENEPNIVVSFRKAIQDRIGYAFVSIKRTRSETKALWSDRHEAY